MRNNRVHNIALVLKYKIYEFMARTGHTARSGASYLPAPASEDPLNSSGYCVEADASLRPERRPG